MREIIEYNHQIIILRLRHGHAWFSQQLFNEKTYQPFCDDCLVLQTVNPLKTSIGEDIEVFWTKEGPPGLQGLNIYYSIIIHLSQSQGADEGC